MQIKRIIILTVLSAFSLVFSFDLSDSTSTVTTTLVPTDTISIIVIPVLPESSYVWVTDSAGDWWSFTHSYKYCTPDSAPDLYATQDFYSEWFSTDTSVGAESIAKFLLESSCHKFFIDTIAVLDSSGQVWGSPNAGDTAASNVYTLSSLIDSALMDRIDAIHDFSQFDYDGNDTVDFVFAIMPVYNCVGVASFGEDTGYVRDGVRIYYGVRDVALARIEVANITAHEMGHSFGLYHPFGGNGGFEPSRHLGSFSTMGYEQYFYDGPLNYDTDYGPSPYNPYWRWRELGWLDSIVVNETQFSYPIKMWEEGNIYKIVSNYGDGQQFFIISHHSTYTNWERDWPDFGSIIFHIDDSRSGQRNPKHKHFDFEHASGLFTWTEDTTVDANDDTLIWTVPDSVDPVFGLDSLDDIYCLIDSAKYRGIVDGTAHTYRCQIGDSLYNLWGGKKVLSKGGHGTSEALWHEGDKFDHTTNPSSNFYSDSDGHQNDLSHIGIHFISGTEHQDSILVDILLNQWSGILDSNTYSWNMSQYEITGDLTISDTCTLITSDTSLIYFPYDEDDQEGGMFDSLPEIIIDGELTDSATWMFYEPVGFYFSNLPKMFDPDTADFPEIDSVYLLSFDVKVTERDGPEYAGNYALIELFNDSLGSHDTIGSVGAVPYDDADIISWGIRFIPSWSEDYDTAGLCFRFIPADWSANSLSDSICLVNVEFKKFAFDDTDYTYLTAPGPHIIPIIDPITPSPWVIIRPIPLPDVVVRDDGNFKFRLHKTGPNFEAYDQIEMLYDEHYTSVLSVSDVNLNYYNLRPDSSETAYEVKLYNDDDITDELSSDDRDFYETDSAGWMYLKFDLSDYTVNNKLVLEVDGIEYVSSSTELKVDAYYPQEKSWKTVGYIPSRVFPHKEFISFAETESDTVDIKLYWTPEYKIDCARLYPKPSEISPSSISLDSAILSSGIDVSTFIDDDDNNFINLLQDEYLDIYFLGDSGADSAKVIDYYLVLRSTSTANPDSFWAEVNITTDTILVKRRGTATAIESAFVCIDDGDTGVCGFTNSAGKYKPGLNLDYTYDIYISKSGFRPLKVQHVDSIYGDEVWCNDVQLLGDSYILPGDTLTILPGTNIRMKPNSDVSSRSGDWTSSRIEIMVYGGHLEVAGTADDMVSFAAGPGGSGAGQWYFIYSRDDGTVNMNYAQSSDSYTEFLFGYNGPHRMLAKNCVSDDAGIYCNFQNDDEDDIFQLENCNITFIYPYYTDDSSWVKNCTISGFDNGCYLYNNRDTLLVEDCVFEDNNYNIYNYLGKARYINCDLSDVNYYNICNRGALLLDTCDIDADSKAQCIYSYSNATVQSRMTIYDGYTSKGVYILDESDFGTQGSPGHNCFLDDNDYAIYFDNQDDSDTLWAEWNYFDTLRFSGSGASKIIHDSTDALCEPDTSLHKRVAFTGKPQVPALYSLGAAVPNPFNSTVELSFAIPEESHVKLEIFDIMGRQIKTILDKELDAGNYKTIWNSKDNNGVEMPSGVYMYRLCCDNFEDTRKMTLIR